MNTNIVAVVSALMMVGTSALAQDDAALSNVVHYSDLNLTSTEGRAQLNGRIEHAIRAVCPRDQFPAGARGAVPLRECFATARASLGSKVDLAIAQANARPLKVAEAHSIR